MGTHEPFLNVKNEKKDKLNLIEPVLNIIYYTVLLNKICEDKSPLMYATKYGNIKYVKKLIENGAEINLKNEEGKTALDYAKKYEQTEIVHYLESIKK